MKHLIVIADPQGGKNQALKRALELQKKAKTRITLLGFCYADVGNEDDLNTAKLSRKKLESTVMEQRQAELDQLLKRFEVPPKSISTKAITTKVMWSKDISQAVIAYCKKQPADMLIKSGHRTETALYTPTDWRLLRECPIPVMITAGKSWKKKARIVVALDFSTKSKPKLRLNDKIMAQAKMLANSLDEEIHIAFALSIPQVLADMDLINPRKYASEKRKSLQPTIDKFCEEHQLDAANVHIKQGKAEKIIPSIANSLKADLVIAGTVGRKGIKGKLMGNTAEDILGNLYTDILAIKP